ncbi:MAG: hypothetical protein E6I75_20000, partial [Chloroflexi bacterium]
MSSTRLRAWKRRWLGLRHPAQNLVEFGIAVAAVSVFGLAGLNMLGRAEEGYFIPLAASLAPQAPSGTDDVMHPTQVTISCSPTTVIVGNPTTCAFTVRDAWTNKRTWPQGSIALYLGTPPGSPTGVTCTLVQDTSSGDGALSKCSVNWSPTISNVPSATLLAHYVPSDGAHAAPTTDPSQTLTVRELPTVTFAPIAGHTTACFDPNNGYAGSPEKVEIGHPIICHLTVTNSGGSIANTPVQVSGSLADAGGTPHFSCFTNNNRTALAACNPEGPSFSGNTDATGQLTFVYRRYYIIPVPTTTATETFT